MGHFPPWTMNLNLPVLYFITCYMLDYVHSFMDSLFAW